MESDASITKQVTFDLTKIYFGSVCHLAFVRDGLVGFHSWKSPPGRFSIELTFRHGATITTEYDSEEKWKTVIDLIQTSLTP